MLFELRGSLRGYRLSAHAARRIRERGFLYEDISRIAEYGEPRQVKGGLLSIRVPDSPFVVLAPDPCQARVAGATVVLDPWNMVVVTVYWAFGDTAPRHDRRPA